MSYILDALNKSDEERQREQPPNLKTVHRKPAAPRRRGPGVWQAALLVLVAGNLLLLYLWLRPAPDPAGQATPAPAVAPATTVSTAPASDGAPGLAADEAVTSEPAIFADPAATDDATAVEELITPPPRGQAVPAVDSANLPLIDELPAAVQRQIPDLSFASHIYSSAPQSRLVSINGRLSREGDRVGQDLVLIAITEEGVLLQFRQYRFRMSILRDWSFD